MRFQLEPFSRLAFVVMVDMGRNIDFNIDFPERSRRARGDCAHDRHAQSKQSRFPNRGTAIDLINAHIGNRHLHTVLNCNAT